MATTFGITVVCGFQLDGYEYSYNKLGTNFSVSLCSCTVLNSNSVHSFYWHCLVLELIMLALMASHGIHGYLLAEHATTREYIC